MSISVLGISHKSADLALRGRCAIHPDPETFKKVAEHFKATQILILSTCNRTEIYSDSPLSSQEQAFGFESLCKLSPNTLSKQIYFHQNTAALKHAITVASGVDSLVMGEPQILGQFKQAYEQARQAGWIQFKLSLFFQSAFRAARRIRHETAIGRCPVSVAYCGLYACGLETFRNKHLTLLGAGETARKVLEHLSRLGLRSITVLNRTLPKAESLATQIRSRFPSLNLRALPLEKSFLLKNLPQTDILISTIRLDKDEPFLDGKDFADRPLNHPLFLIDLSVPRTIEKSVQTHPSITLIDMDEIQAFVEKHRSYRSRSFETIEQIIQESLEEYEKTRLTRQFSKGIVQFRTQIEKIIETELHKALASLEKNENPEAVIQKFAHRIKQKWLHHPSKKLHSAASLGQHEFFKMAHELFDL